MATLSLVFIRNVWERHDPLIKGGGRERKRKHHLKRMDRGTGTLVNWGGGEGVGGRSANEKRVFRR